MCNECASEPTVTAPPDIVAALSALLGPLDDPDRWGYGAAHNALSDNIRLPARAVLARYVAAKAARERGSR